MGSIVSVDTLQGLTSGQVTLPTGHKIKGADVGSVYAPGSTIQVITRILNGTTQSIATTTETQLDGWNQTITKKYANSMLVCWIKFYNYPSAAPGGSWWQLRAKANGSYVTSSGPSYSEIASHNHNAYTYAGSAHQQYYTNFWDTTNATTVNFTFFASHTSTPSIVWWNNPVTWTFMEIAQ
jgi:hypothetical protein